MGLWKTINIALIALRLNALRSFLTMLGIIIGIASVIVMVSVSSGSKQEIEKAIDQLGSNMLNIRPGAQMSRGRHSGAGSATPFTEKDIKRLKDKFAFLDGISGSISASAPVVYGNRNWTTSIYGVHMDYINVRQWVIEEGRNFTEHEVRSGGKVALLGQDVIEQLFDGGSPMGARIRIKNVPFTVIGTLQGKGESSFGRSQDDIIFIPISTARMRVSGRSARSVPDVVGNIYLTVNPDRDISVAEEELEEFLREVRKIAPGAQDDFAVRNFSEFIRTRNETSTTLGLLLAATAAIALLVGGIGIMNIMLVSVTERTREIGLRLAIGARQNDILMQFLVEAVTLCLIGSFFGVAIGVGAGEIIRQTSEIPVLLNIPIIFIAISSATFVGIFFGFYPARKASRMNPIDALRYE
ncbi:MAG: FtsX-like permease family protein [Gammaproteobacteria bacterium]|nr:FtsX-like permease family protein [Gammaproteobacteria bacterium]